MFTHCRLDSANPQQSRLRSGSWHGPRDYCVNDIHIRVRTGSVHAQKYQILVFPLPSNFPHGSLLLNLPVVMAFETATRISTYGKKVRLQAASTHYSNSYTICTSENNEITNPMGRMVSLFINHLFNIPRILISGIPSGQ